MILISILLGHIAMVQKKGSVMGNRLLVIDDEEVTLDLMEQALKRLGHEVSAFTQSAEALKLFTQTPHAFDLIITDKSMPVINGHDLLKEIKRINHNVPVILLTGYLSKETEESIRHEIPDVTILFKPMRIKDIQMEIEKKLKDFAD